MDSHQIADRSPLPWKSLVFSFQFEVFSGIDEGWRFFCCGRPLPRPIRRLADYRPLPAVNSIIRSTATKLEKPLLSE